MGARPWRLAVALSAGMLLHPWVEAYTELPRVTETDAQGFISEFTLAGQRCDSTWHEAHILPSAALTFELRGEPPYTTTRDDYVEEVRAHCRYWWGILSPDQHNFSVQTQQYGPAIVKVKWPARAAEQLFFFESRDLAEVEGTISLVHDGNGVRIQDWRVVGTPSPQGQRP